MLVVNLSLGIIGQATTVVNEQNTAIAMKSGTLPVFATPAMVALMEEASCEVIANYLEEGEGTVGIKMNVDHIAPTGLNDTVRATATLTQIEGRKLIFSVEVRDNQKIIGKGIHERFIINNEKFMQKLKSK